jgi:hypothetical protein
MRLAISKRIRDFSVSASANNEVEARRGAGTCGRAAQGLQLAADTHLVVRISVAEATLKEDLVARDAGWEAFLSPHHIPICAAFKWST